MEWKENKLPQLISHLKAITAQHQAELEKAIIGRGEWHFCPQYATLQVPESVWFYIMKPETKEKHLKKVQTCKLEQSLELKTATERVSVKQPHSTFEHLSRECWTAINIVLNSD